MSIDVDVLVETTLVTIVVSDTDNDVVVDGE